MCTYNVYKTIRLDDVITYNACIITVRLTSSNYNDFKAKLTAIADRFNNNLVQCGYTLSFDLILNAPYDTEDAIEMIDDSIKYQEVMYETRVLYDTESQDKKRRQLEPIIDDLKESVSEVGNTDKDY